MDISVGKTYKITNKDKKTYYEEIEFKNEDGDSLTKQSCYRQGVVHLTPQNDDEVEALLDSIEDDDGIELSDFEVWESVSVYDEVSVEWEEDGGYSYEDIEELVVENESELSAEEYMEEELGYKESGWTHYWINGSLSLENV